MNYQIIKNQADAEAFLTRFYGLHDGIVTAVDYHADIKAEADGMRMVENWQGHSMTLVILTANEGAPMVEMVFEGVFDWHIRCDSHISFFGILMKVGEKGSVIFTDCHTTEGEAFRNSTYICAASVRWREVSSANTLVIENGNQLVSMEIVDRFEKGKNQPWEAYRMRVRGKGTFSTFDMFADADRRSLEALYSSLVRFYEEPEGELMNRFSHDGNFCLKMEFELTGRVKVEADIYDVPMEQNQCHIEFYTDQTFIAQSIEQLKKMLEKK